MHKSNQSRSENRNQSSKNSQTVKDRNKQIFQHVSLFFFLPFPVSIFQLDSSLIFTLDLVLCLLTCRLASLYHSSLITFYPVLPHLLFHTHHLKKKIFSLSLHAQDFEGKACLTDKGNLHREEKVQDGKAADKVTGSKVRGRLICSCCGCCSVCSWDSMVLELRRAASTVPYNQRTNNQKSQRCTESLENGERK